jgi:multiple antibiotic resistance protein
MVGLALFGNWLLHQLGIVLPAFQTAGGLLLFGVSFRMMFGDRPKAMSEHASDVAVFPLAIPLMAGPGARSRPFCYCPATLFGSPGRSS